MPCSPGFVHDDLLGMSSTCILPPWARYAAVGAVGALALVGLALNSVAGYRTARTGMLQYTAYSGIALSLLTVLYCISLAAEGNTTGVQSPNPKVASSIFQRLMSIGTILASLVLAMTFTLTVSKQRELNARKKGFVVFNFCAVCLLACCVAQIVFSLQGRAREYDIGLGVIYFVECLYCFWYARFVWVESRHLERILVQRMEALASTQTSGKHDTASTIAIKSLGRGRAFVNRAAGTTAALASQGVLACGLMSLKMLTFPSVLEAPGHSIRIVLFLILNLSIALLTVILGVYGLQMSVNVSLRGSSQHASSSGKVASEIRGMFAYAKGGKLFELLSDSNVASRLEAHLENEFTHEHLDFLKAVGHWKQVFYDQAPSAVTATAKKIVARFLKSDSEQLVNVSESMRTSVEETINANGPLDIGVFDEVCREVERILEHGAVSRFTDQEALVAQIMIQDENVRGTSMREMPVTSSSSHWSSFALPSRFFSKR